MYICVGGCGCGCGCVYVYIYMYVYTYIYVCIYIYIYKHINIYKRRLQDPLREISGLCTGKSEDVLTLPLHRLQDCVDKGERVKHLHRLLLYVCMYVCMLDCVDKGERVKHLHRLLLYVCMYVCVYVC